MLYYEEEAYHRRPHPHPQMQMCRHGEWATLEARRRFRWMKAPPQRQVQPMPMLREVPRRAATSPS